MDEIDHVMLPVVRDFRGFILKILLYCVDALMLCLMLATRARVA